MYRRTKTCPLTSLFVSDLHPEVSEKMLLEKFSQAGPVHAVSLCRDDNTKQSLGCAYVYYRQLTDAKMAFNTMNFDPIKGRPMCISWIPPNPSFSKYKVGNIFIKNLDKSIDSKALHDTFLSFGNILSCKLSCDGGVSKGYGFVHFETEEAALRAIDKLNGTYIKDKKVVVTKFLTREERTKMKLNQKYGIFKSVVGMKHKTRAFQGCGLVDFDTHKEAQHADNINGTAVENSILDVELVKDKSEQQKELHNQIEAQKQDRIQRFQGLILYVKNLDDNITDDDLREVFTKYGTILSAKIIYKAGHSRGFGFVCFSSLEEAKKAMTEMNGRIVGSKPLYVALAQRREDRKAHLTAQYLQRMTSSMGVRMAAMAGDTRTVGPRAQSGPAIRPMTTPVGTRGALHPSNRMPQIVVQEHEKPCSSQSDQMQKLKLQEQVVEDAKNP